MEPKGFDIYRYRNCRLEVRLTPGELNLLEVEAQLANTSKSDFIRKMIMDRKIQYRGFIMLNDERIRKLFYEINRIGNNLNQIAYNANFSQDVTSAEVDEIVSMYQDTLEKITEHFLSDEVTAEIDIKELLRCIWKQPPKENG